MSERCGVARKDLANLHEAAKFGISKANQTGQARRCKNRYWQGAAAKIGISAEGKTKSANADDEEYGSRIYCVSWTSCRKFII